MTEPIRIRMGGYGPPTTTHSRALAFLGERLEDAFADGVEVEYVWNVMDHGHAGEDVLWMVERGELTLAYQSTSYLTARVPELSIADLPFLFRDLAHARGAMDGALGAYFTERIEARIGYRMLGYLENGFRQISNRLRPVRTPSDLAGMRIRLLPSEVHVQTFERLGTVPVPCDLKVGLEMVRSGEVDAQENPFANTVTYGAHEHHRYHTVSNHFYLSRGLYCNRAAFDRWPEALRAEILAAAADAVAHQREWAVAEERAAREVVETSGGEIADLDGDERAAFAAAVTPLHREARDRFGADAFALAARD